jgi:hypothetical protein
MFDSPGPRSASVGSPLAKTELGNSIGAGYSPKQSALGKYKRSVVTSQPTVATGADFSLSSCAGMSVSINSQEAIDRLLDN